MASGCKQCSTCKGFSAKTKFTKFCTSCAHPRANHFPEDTAESPPVINTDSAFESDNMPDPFSPLASPADGNSAFCFEVPQELHNTIFKKQGATQNYSGPTLLSSMSTADSPLKKTSLTVRQSPYNPKLIEQSPTSSNLLIPCAGAPFGCMWQGSIDAEDAHRNGCSTCNYLPILNYLQTQNNEYKAQLEELKQDHELQHQELKLKYQKIKDQLRVFVETVGESYILRRRIVLHEGSFTKTDVYLAGLSFSDLDHLGYTLTEMREVGFTAYDLNLQKLSYQPSQLLAAGYSLTEIRAAGYSPLDLKECGCRYNIE